MKKIILSLLTIFTLTSLSAQNTVGTGIQATSGVGKYKKAIYWLNFGRVGTKEVLNYRIPAGSKIKDGDKSIFTTPNNTRYEVEISNIHKIWSQNSWENGFVFSTHTENTKWVGGNNFPYAYNFDDENGNPVYTDETAVSIRASQYTEMGFRITVKASRPNPNFDSTKPAGVGNEEYLPVKSNIILAGTESLADPSDESYSLTSLVTNLKGEPSKINVIETYMSRRGDNSTYYMKNHPELLRGQSDYNGFSLKVDAISTTMDINGQPKPATKLYATNPSGLDCRGDVMFAALNTNVVDVTLKSSGGTCIALGVLDLVDSGDMLLNRMKQTLKIQQYIPLSLV